MHDELRSAAARRVDEVPPPVVDVTSLASNPVAAWLWTDGWEIPTLKELTHGLAHAMLRAGVPLYRLRLTLRTMHPQLAGLSNTWRRGDDSVEEFWPPLTILQEDVFLRSPYAVLFEGAGAVRRRLDIPGIPTEFPLLEELRQRGVTDYVALPLIFSDGRISALTLATDRPGGFVERELQVVADSLPAIARLMELHALRRTAQIVLDTYLGRLTGARVLEGRIHRGDGDDLFAVIWLSDLRASTALADALPRRTYLDLLNSYFECMAGAVIENGGDVLKFIGDALLAIFPIGPVEAGGTHEPLVADACGAALAAARDALRRVDSLNVRRHNRGESPLRFGIGLNLGEVMYGNVGSLDRLDFTVVGPAVNATARLEAMCKVLDRPVIISAEIARAVQEPLVSLGFHALRGVRQPHELFTLPDSP